MVLRLSSSATGLALLAMVTTQAAEGQAQSVKADHTTVTAEGLPAEALEAARELRMSFSHASVGGNIWGELTALSSAEEGYEFPNWTDNNRGNPGWEAKISEFEAWVASHEDEYDVFQNKFCYIDQGAEFESYRDSMLSLAEQHSDKVFVWWTMPLETQGENNSLRQAFNEQVRSYCAAHDLPLYDIADIESHTPEGDAVTVDGVEAMDPEQSSDGGHLAELGASRAAQAQWVLMSALAGHDAPDSDVAASPPADNVASGQGQGTAAAGAAAVASSSTEPDEGGAGDASGCSLSQRGTGTSAGALSLWGLALSAAALGCRRRRQHVGRRGGR